MLPQRCYASTSAVLCRGHGANRGSAVYRVSGVVILICLILAYLLSTVTYSLLVLETIILVFFGLSWFMKGRKILFGG
jgi:hypothetical protein